MFDCFVNIWATFENFLGKWFKISWWWRSIAVFKNFLEAENRFKQTNPITIIVSLWGVFQLNVRVGNFSIMSHLSRGYEIKAVLNHLQNMKREAVIPIWYCEVHIWRKQIIMFPFPEMNRVSPAESNTIQQ